MAKARNPLDRLRKIIAQWPETDERISHGAPTFWGGRRTFACFHPDTHGTGGEAVLFKAPPDVQDELVELDPSLFFVPRYVGPSGWVGLRLDADTDWELVESLLEQGYRMVAPKRALKLLDAPR